MPGTPATERGYPGYRAEDARFAPLLMPRRRDLPGPAGLPGTAGLSPTITPGTGGTTTSSISGGVRIWPDRYDAFAYSIPTSLLSFGGTFPDTNYLTPLASAQSNNTTSSKVTPPLRQSFYHYGQKFEVCVKACNAYRIIVDGQQVTANGAATVSHDSNQYVDLVDFGSVGYRRIDIDYSANTPRLAGIFIEPTGSITAAPSRAPRVAFVSDSFGEGTGATAGWTSWAYSLAAMCGWAPWSSSWGGTGYLNPNSGLGRTKVRDRLAADVLNGSPDIIVWGNGYNDFAGTYTAAATGAEALACFQAARAALPKVQQIVVGPWWHSGAQTMPQLLLNIRDAIKASAAAVGALWLDPLEGALSGQAGAFSTTVIAASPTSVNTTGISVAGRPGGSSGVGTSGIGLTVEIGTGATRERRIATSWSGSGPFSLGFAGGLVYAHSGGEPVTVVGPALWTGTGRVGATANDGNSDLFVSTDGVHPSQAGHDALARWLYQQLLLALPA